MVQGAQSIYRTVDILDVLLGSHGGMTAKEVIEVAGLPASTTHRILTVLCERGLVRQADAPVFSWQCVDGGLLVGIAPDALQPLL